MMELGEMCMMKHSLKQQTEARNKIMKYQQDMELKKLKEMNPGKFFVCVKA